MPDEVSKFITLSRLLHARMTVAFHEASILAASFPTPLFEPVIIATCGPTGGQEVLLVA